RLQRLRARPGRARDPAVLLHGADRMGRTPAPRKKADARTRRRLAESGRTEIRYVYRRALPRAVGLIGIPAPAAASPSPISTASPGPRPSSATAPVEVIKKEMEEAGY